MATPVPENHREYDAHLMHASMHGPQWDVMNQQCSDREHYSYYCNYWTVPWYLRPHIQESTYTIDDFAADVRSRVERVLRERAGTDATMPTGNPAEMKRLMTHLTHTILQFGCAFHNRWMEKDDAVAEMRESVKEVANARYTLCSAAHPFWNMAGPVQHDRRTGCLVRTAQHKPTTQERAFARWLAQPDFNLRTPDGNLAEILEEAQPFLLSAAKGSVVEYAHDLRKRLKNSLRGKSAWTPALQTDCVEQIADAWRETLPSDGHEQVKALTEDWDLSAAALVHEHFPDQVIENRAAFEQKKFLLEQTSIIVSINAVRQECATALEELEALYGVWEKASFHHRYLLPEHPTLGLAFLAGEAACSSLPEFRSRL